MDMERWHDKEFTVRWDRQIADSYPSRALQVSLLVSLLKGLYEPDNWIVDLGFGSGRVEEQLLLARDDARIVGIDSSAAMIDLARQRLARWSAQWQPVQHDLAEIDTVALPAGAYQIAISVQVLHHLKHEAQRAQHRWAHKILEPGGWYLIIDKRELADGDLAPYELAWDALEQNPQWRTGRSFAEHLQHEREKGHTPATMEQALDWLAEAGFAASCLHAHLDRLLIVARKK
jgi:ubiquinone/menaquinone biosynthesis C-methylase UbiE